MSDRLHEAHRIGDPDVGVSRDDGSEALRTVEENRRRHAQSGSLEEAAVLCVELLAV